jgi:hypothetical protein
VARRLALVSVLRSQCLEYQVFFASSCVNGRSTVGPAEAIGTQIKYKYGSATHAAELPGAWRATEHPTELAAQ